MSEVENLQVKMNYKFGSRIELYTEKDLGLSADDVVDVEAGLGYDSKIVTFISFMRTVNNWISLQNEQWPKPRNTWFTEGIKCKVLRAKGGGWQKGRFRFRLEFIPDNPEDFNQVVSNEVIPAQDSIHMDT